MLNNNLKKKKDRFLLEMQEHSSNDRRERLDSLNAEQQAVDQRVADNKKNGKGILFTHLFWSFFVFIFLAAIYQYLVTVSKCTCFNFFYSTRFKVLCPAEWPFGFGM